MRLPVQQHQSRSTLGIPHTTPVQLTPLYALLACSHTTYLQHRMHGQSLCGSAPAERVSHALGCSETIPLPPPYFPFTSPSLYLTLSVMAGLAAATCDASFRCNGCVAVSPGACPPVLQRRPTRHKHIRLVPVCRGDHYLLSGLGLLTLTLLAPEITVSWHTSNAHGGMPPRPIQAATCWSRRAHGSHRTARYRACCDSRVTAS